MRGSDSRSSPPTNNKKNEKLRRIKEEAQNAIVSGCI